MVTRKPWLMYSVKSSGTCQLQREYKEAGLADYKGKRIVEHILWDDMHTVVTVTKYTRQECTPDFNEVGKKYWTQINDKWK